MYCITSWKNCFVLQRTTVLFFEELSCSLNHCYVFWTSTVFFELLFFILINVIFSLKNCLLWNEEQSFLKNRLLWRTIFFELLFCSYNYSVPSRTVFFELFFCSLDYYCVLWIIVLFFELFFSSLNCPSCITQSLTLTVGTMEFNITQRVLKDQYGRR